jgi:hypothetical protein
MSTSWKTLLAAAFCAMISWGAGQAQAPPPTILVVDVENVVQYFEDSSDLSRFATDPNVTNPVLPRNLNAGLVIGDIVAVNGQSAKGTMTRNARSVFLNTAPRPARQSPTLCGMQQLHLPLKS